MQDYKQYGALALAYMGDSVYETEIRKHLMEKGNMPVNTLHRMAKGYVSAAAQSEFMDILEPILTAEELAVYKRGRNAKPHTSPKNAALSDYKKATGMETLLGYLYLNGNKDRVKELINIIITEKEENKSGTNN